MSTQDNRRPISTFGKVSRSAHCEKRKQRVDRNLQVEEFGVGLAFFKGPGITGMSGKQSISHRGLDRARRRGHGPVAAQAAQTRAALSESNPLARLRGRESLTLPGRRHFGIGSFIFSVLRCRLLPFFPRRAVCLRGLAFPNLGCPDAPVLTKTPPRIDAQSSALGFRREALDYIAMQQSLAERQGA